MRLRDTEACIEACIEKFSRPESEEGEVFAHATGRAVIPGAGIGITKVGRSYKVLLYTSDANLVRKIRRESAGELVHRPFQVATPRITSTWSKQPHRVKFIGNQAGPVGDPWVGTGGIFVVAVDNPEVILQITNEHVTGLGAQRGKRMHQGGKVYGSVWQVGGISFIAPNEFDVGSVALAPTEFWSRWDHGIDHDIEGIRDPNPDDIGREATNTGQTEGTMRGICDGIRIHGIGVDHGNGRVAIFNNRTAFRTPGGGSFSVGGHSGATIVMVHDRHAVALLDSGGISRGEDITFSSSLPGAIRAAGGVPELI